MARVRKIKRNPHHYKNYFVVDACFLANKYIPPAKAPKGHERDRINKCREWWKEIHSQLQKHKARVYIPDICIAETFKTLAKKYYQDKWFKNTDLKSARKKLRKDITILPQTLYAQDRFIPYHDIPTSRDIIIAVDRFYELFQKHEPHVSLPDLIILATAKYLIDFYDIPKQYLHIVTLDKPLWRGSKKIAELPNAYDPTEPRDACGLIFAED